MQGPGRSNWLFAGSLRGGQRASKVWWPLLQTKAEIDRLKDIQKPQSMLKSIEKTAQIQEENQMLKAELSKSAKLAQRFIYNSRHKFSEVQWAKDNS